MSRAAVVATLVVLVGTSLLVWAWNMTQVPTLVNDDAFIYVRYAVNWVDHGTLAWNLGGPGGDGFTSWAYQALAALAYLCHGGDPVASLWYVAAAAGTLTVVVSLLLPLGGGWTRGPRPAATALAALSATLVASALNPQFAYFTHSLMETGLVAVAVCLGSWGTAHLLTESPGSGWRSVLAGTALGSLALVRPEGLIVCAVVLTPATVRIVGARVRHPLFRRLVAAADHRAAKALAVGLLTAGLIAGSCFLWHLSRYHHPLPNPVYVKTGGVSAASIGQGLRYLAAGPAAGALPLGAFRATASSPAERVDWQTVHAAITPDRSALPCWALLALLPILWLLSFQRSAFTCSRDAMFLRHFLLVPTGWLMLVVLAGGDMSHSGWRFVTPLLPTVTAAAVLGVRWTSRQAVAWALWGVLALLAARTVQVAVVRPELCRSAASACGIAAIRRWPPTLTSYDWDVSNAWYDRRFAEAIRESFPPTAVIGQADFLRIGAQLPEYTIADLSGLTDSELAHSPHGPEIRLFSSDLLADVRPDVYVYGYRFISTRALADHRLGDPEVRELLYPWPPRGSPEGLRKLVALYAGASLALPDGTFFNFLVLRRAIPAMTSRAHVAIGR